MGKDKSMSEAMLLQLMAVNDMLGGITLEDIKILKGGHLKFSVYTDADYMNAEITALELGTRPMNGLLRKGYKTVKELVDDIQNNDDLRSIRGMGDKSCEEIMLGIFLYQFRCLSKEKQGYWLSEFLKLNGITKAK